MKQESYTGSNPPHCSPSSIYLQWHGDSEPSDAYDPPLESEVTWCREKIFDHDIRYVRWDLVERLLRDVMQIHADQGSPEYNYCDEDKCQWCEWASELFPENADVMARREKSPNQLES